ncbi:hypothetical protein T10_13321 [Trichinella papuae]|uniref:Uncharacterized protein n=1 Tax=Trichinella papuae TaxID=268474 RepID=A0A0V1N5I8_9BILA|nr:hypothetical protein T10_13321 [Trichinella papuae]
MRKMPKVQSATEWNILPGVTTSYFTCWANKMRVVGRKLTKLWKAEAEAEAFYPECFVQSCGVVRACTVSGDGVAVTVAPVVTHRGGFLLLFHPDQQVNNGSNHAEHGHQHEQYPHLADVFGQVVHVVGHLEHLRQFSQHLVKADRVRCQIGHSFQHWLVDAKKLTLMLTSGREATLNGTKGCMMIMAGWLKNKNKKTKNRKRPKDSNVVDADVLSRR